MEIDVLSPKMMSVSSYHVWLWRNSVILVSKAVRFVNFAWYIHSNSLQMRHTEQRDGSMDVHRCWAYIPFQDYLSVVLKT
jgi:hypothetical protein